MVLESTATINGVVSQMSKGLVLGAITKVWPVYGVRHDKSLTALYLHNKDSYSVRRSVDATQSENSWVLQRCLHHKSHRYASALDVSGWLRIAYPNNSLEGPGVDGEDIAVVVEEGLGLKPAQEASQNVITRNM